MQTAAVCVCNLLIAVESSVAILTLDRYLARQNANRDLTVVLSAWTMVQYVCFGASVVFAVTVWVTRSMKAVTLLANALFFAICTLQWLVVSLCTFIGGYTTTGIVFAALALHPLAGFLVSRSLGRQAREEAERQEALDTIREHEESLYQSTEV